MMNSYKLVKHLPNLLTLTNLSLGLGSILLLIQSEHPHKTGIASICIILGAVSDFFDGFLARKLNAFTMMGKQLDSFADIITFGVAPIILINYVSCHPPIFIIGPSLLFMIAGTYRLTKYNMNDSNQHFVGLPITAAGVSLTFYCLIYPMWSIHVHLCTVITNLTLLALAFMMVSKKQIKRITFKSD